MEDYTKYTKEELINLQHNAEDVFKQCQDIIKQAYAEMKDSSDEYIAITNELKKRNNE